MRFNFISATAALAFGSAASLCSADEGLRVDPDFAGKKAATSISGALCPGEDRAMQWCVSVNDEKRNIQYFRIDNGTIIPGGRIRILAKATLKGDDENGCALDQADMEAAAYDGGYVYITGSHGVSRKCGKVQPSRFQLVRFPVSPASGKPFFDLKLGGKPPKTVSEGVEHTDKLRRLIRDTAPLSAFAEMRLDENGANIEGIGARGGQLFFGFRTPVLESGAIVLEVAADALFGATPPAPVAHKLHLGVGYGIRDMARVGDTFMILAGASGGADLAPTIWAWVPGSTPILQTVLRVNKGQKAETLLLVNINKTSPIPAIVFFDDEQNGNPIAIELPAIRPQ